MRTLLLCLPLLLIGCATSQSSRRIVSTAEHWVGKRYKPGQSLQCADFVGHCVRKSGGKVPANYTLARAWLAWGRSVPLSFAQPGDVIVLWRDSRRGTRGHILIYAGNGKAIHRPTRSSPVCTVAVSQYRERVLGVRRASGIQSQAAYTPQKVPKTPEKSRHYEVATVNSRKPYYHTKTAG